MNKLDEIRLMNDSTIEYLKLMNSSYEKNSIIENILKDDSCFFKISKDDAKDILLSVGVSDAQCNSIYESLISKEEYYRLVHVGKIKESDDLKVRYDGYNPNVVFENIVEKIKTAEESIDDIKSEKVVDDKVINSTEENIKVETNLKSSSIFDKIKGFLPKLF